MQYLPQEFSHFQAYKYKPRGRGEICSGAFDNMLPFEIFNVAFRVNELTVHSSPKHTPLVSHLPSFFSSLRLGETLPGICIFLSQYVSSVTKKQTSCRLFWDSNENRSPPISAQWKTAAKKTQPAHLLHYLYIQEQINILVTSHQGF